ncbi:hypothetical protein IO99_00665 [Clostridium sulfidigenes]|uniref:Uncharacterized protein n=1 Tax=Clostridium sulfidigenes TaxID=318464 RepID=A0A084JID8_9CLOT|nr:hypothetical protein [Clostridium sulfidigenes]KEZ88722.1 hypothetical protein IO99_00665 [Clostridium sulfidigenes]
MFYEVNIKDYIPSYLKDIREFELISQVESTKINELTNDMKKNLDNSCIVSMDEESIIRTEIFLNIQPEGNLEQRRQYLLALGRKRDKLNEVTIKSMVMAIMNVDSTVKFYTGSEENSPEHGQGVIQIMVFPSSNQEEFRFEDIERALKPLIPGHIKLNVTRYYSSWRDVMNNFTNWRNIKDTMKNWRELYYYMPQN